MPLKKSSNAQRTNSKNNKKSQNNLREFPRKAAPQKIEQPKAPLPKQHQQRPGIEQEMEPKPKYHAPFYRGSNKLEGKVALISGGDSGIGRSVAVLYAREGANVGIVYLPEEQRDAEETASAVEQEGRECLLIPGDVSNAQFCKQAVEQTVEEFGALDILVNNAAYQQHQEKFEDVSEEQFERTFRTNIFGYFYMARNAVKHMKKGGAIINTSPSPACKGTSSCWITPRPRARSTPLPSHWRRCWLSAAFA